MEQRQARFSAISLYLRLGRAFASRKEVLLSLYMVQYAYRNPKTGEGGYLALEKECEMKLEQVEAMYRRLKLGGRNSPRLSRPAPGHAGHSHFGRQALSRRQFLRTTGTAVLGAGLGTASGSKLWSSPLAVAPGPYEPIPIPGGTPVLGGGYHVFGPGTIDPDDAEPSSITDFDGFVGISFTSGTCTRTNTQTGEILTLPFVNNDMRFMKGVFRGMDGEIHHGAFGFV
jgi:hypothetical protein